MRYLIVASALFLSPVAFADTHISVGINAPGVSIGFNMPTYPDLVLVPGTPVYYDPRASANYFFYDGLYWVYQEDNWYASSWYDGPWGYVSPYDVPAFVLRVPVRYYRRAPAYFRGWRGDAPPQWGEHWGQDWKQRRGGWDRWNRTSVPRAAPLPTYQRTYTNDRYPRAPDRQREIQSNSYRYQPRERVVIQSERPAHEKREQHQPARQQPEQRAQGKKNQDAGRGQGDHRDEGKGDKGKRDEH